ncbi:MAG: class I SAM-dependent methyltransferase [Xanthomonadales bacterium]|nr:class I SAM-dependent methyltransferase [Xanthomonadales bacterium]
MRELSRLTRRHPQWEPGRVALWQIAQVAGQESEAALRLTGFPGSAFERAQVESFQWMGQAEWRAFEPEVLRCAMDAVTTGTVIVECGVFHGHSIRVMADLTELPVHGFDSFEGLPEAWGHLPAGSYSTEGRLPDVPAGVTLHRGWFEDTLPRFVADHADATIALAHIDCDLYSSTRTALAALQPLFRPGSVLVFDDLLGYPDFRHHELRAFEEFAEEFGWKREPIAAALVGREAAFTLTRS